MRLSVSNEGKRKLMGEKKDRVGVRRWRVSEESKSKLIGDKKRGLMFWLCCCVKGYFRDGKVYGKGKVGDFEWKVMRKKLIDDRV